RRGTGDNGNVNVSRIGDSMVALTETPAPVRFDPATLETLGVYRYRDNMVGQITTAHPQFDAQRRCQYNYLLEFGRISKYHLYGLDADDQQRRRIATIPVQQPAYMHSFGMSSRYLILTEFPLVVNPLKLLLRHQPFIRNYRWQPELGTVFHIVDKETGEVVKTAHSEPFFAFHHVNAFECGDEVVVDIVAYPDASVVDQLYLDRLQSGLPVTATGQLRRFRIGLGASGGVTVETLAAVPLELPRFNYHSRAMRPYRYVYGAGSRGEGSFIDCLVKLDIEDGTAAAWHENGCYPGEPVFVAAPAAAAEDQGLVLSVVLDAAAGNSFLLLLDASSFTEIARVQLPHHIPFGFHGNFFEQPKAREAPLNA
ncbi:MAG TPA: carotenoid oxygenase family protein, partial [Gammaproteobacteria bacterium]|nr:carotenoid oxygenase family protein [Gammaproteobacteria bacterium]